jgi:hypothetical protein
MFRTVSVETMWHSVVWNVDSNVSKTNSSSILKLEVIRLKMLPDDTRRETGVGWTPLTLRHRQTGTPCPGQQEHKLYCVMTVLWTLSVVLRVKYENIRKLKSQRFGSWLCFRLQVNGGGGEKNTYSIGPFRQSKPPSLDVCLRAPTE